MSCSAAKRMSATSWSEIDGRLIRTPGRIDVLPRSQDPAVQHPAAEIALAYFQYLQVDQSVVERDPTTHLQLMHHVLVVDVDGSLLRILGGADGDVDLLTDLEG